MTRFIMTVTKLTGWWVWRSNHAQPISGYRYSNEARVKSGYTGQDIVTTHLLFVLPMNYFGTIMLVICQNNI